MNQLKEHIEQSLKEFEEKFGMNIDWGITHSAGDYGLDAPGFEEITNFFRAQQLSLIEKIIAMVEGMEWKDRYTGNDWQNGVVDGRIQVLSDLKSKLKELL